MIEIVAIVVFGIGAAYFIVEAILSKFYIVKKKMTKEEEEKAIERLVKLLKDKEGFIPLEEI